MDVVVEEGGAGGGTKQLREFVDRAASSRPPEPVQVEVTMGSATSWDRPVDRSYFVRMRRGDRAVTVAWGLRLTSAESLAERVVDLLGLAGRPPGLAKRELSSRAGEHKGVPEP